jgi:hypothetical protein
MLMIQLLEGYGVEDKKKLPFVFKMDFLKKS